MGAMAVGLGLGAAASIYAGIQQKKEADIQANIAREESIAEAKKKGEEAEKFMESQELSYLKSGVMLEGSPLMVLADTSRKSLEEQRSIRRAGSAKAETLKRTGRAALISGLLGGGAGIAKGYAASTATKTPAAKQKAE